MPDHHPSCFRTEELAIVLSHYDLGVIESITSLRKGSQGSPKVGIVAERGKFLLKRRARDRCNPDRIRFAHEVQRHLKHAGFPAPDVMATRSGQRTFLTLRDDVYELFEFVPGRHYRGITTEAHSAGETLARFHLVAADLHSRAPIPKGDYHNNPAVRNGLHTVGKRLSDTADADELLQKLASAYDVAAQEVERCGLFGLPVAVIHSDYHPGNVLFRSGRVVALIDYDSVRVSRRIVEVANGALQFSMIGGDEPGDWPDHLDLTHYHAFLAGYEQRSPLAPEERGCLPHLMAEALIAECVPPIMKTGRFGHHPGFPFLQMVLRKLTWMTDHLADLCNTAPSGR